MDRNTKVNRYLILLLAFNVFLALLAVFLFLDLQEGRLAEVDRLNLELTSLQVTKAEANNIDQIVRDSRGQRDRLNLYFINKESTANFIEELESLADRIGVAFKLNELNVVKDTKQVLQPGQIRSSSLRLGFRAEGNFSDVFKFVKVLERLPYQVSFGAVKIARSEDDTNNINRTKSPIWYTEVTMDLISYLDN